MRLSQETAYLPARILSERDRTVNLLRQFAAMLREGSWVRASIDTAQPERKPIPKPDIRQYQIPIGPVAVFGASNFPQAYSTAGGDTASALASGCPVVVKAHPGHPGTSDIYAEAILEAAQKTGMPEGVFSLLHGVSHSVGTALVRNSNIRAVGFTGSYRGGRALFDVAAQRPDPIPVYAEMGSSNPIFFLPETVAANRGDLATGLVQSLTMYAGQFCTCPGLVIALRNPETESFFALILEKLRESPVGTMVNASIKSGYEATLQSKLKHPEVELLFKSKSTGAHQDTDAQPALLQMRALDIIQKPELGEEVFGPACLLVLCENAREMEQVAESLKGHLAGAIHGTEGDLLRFSGLFPTLRQKVGRLIVNGFPTGVEVCPSMHHGGPFPASTFEHFTSVGINAIYRFTRPMCYQDLPDALLPVELQMQNPLAIWRMVNGEWQW